MVLIMNWSKAKTILITLFVFVNLFLIVILVVTNNNYITINKDSINNVVLLLGSKGIKVDAKIIPQKMNNVISLDVKRAMDSKQAFANVAFGAGNYKNDNDVYSSNIGTLKFDKGLFDLTYTVPFQKFSKLSSEDAEDNATAILKRFKFDTKYLKTDSITKTPDGFIVNLIQKYKGREIVGIGLGVTMTKDGISEIKGRWLSGDIIASKPIDTRHITSVLVDFLNNKDRAQDKPIKITDISMGYHVNSADYDFENKTLQAVPAYIIKTDEGRSYYFDARNGVSSELKYLGFSCREES